MPTGYRGNQEFPQTLQYYWRQKLVGPINASGIFASADKMQPFYTLLKPKAPFKWMEQMNNHFGEAKTIIIQEIQEGEEIFNKKRPTCLATGFNKDGISFWLLQKHCECTSTKPFYCRVGWKVPLEGRRFTSLAESRYAPIEGEHNQISLHFALVKKTPFWGLALLPGMIFMWPPTMRTQWSS